MDGEPAHVCEAVVAALGYLDDFQFFVHQLQHDDMARMLLIAGAGPVSVGDVQGFAVRRPGALRCPRHDRFALELGLLAVHDIEQ
jgi:hypothetical protein